jgi:hypothetical protein
MIRAAIAVTLLGLGLTLGQTQSEGRSKFSGTWRMDAAKSDFGSGPVSESRLDVISYTEPVLKDHVTQKLRGPEATYDLMYSTDGKESTNKVRGNTVKSIARWDGYELVVDSQVFALRKAAMNDRWSISADGKTLTLVRHLTGAVEGDQKIVFERQ